MELHCNMGWEAQRQAQETSPQGTGGQRTPKQRDTQGGSPMQYISQARTLSPLMGMGRNPWLSSEGPGEHLIVSPPLDRIMGWRGTSPVLGRMCKVRAAPGSLKSLPNADRVGGADQAQDPLGSWQGPQRLREEQETEAGVCPWRERLGSQRDDSQGVKDDSDDVHEPPLQPTSLQETLGSSQQCSALRGYILSSPRTRPATPPTRPVLGLLSRHSLQQKPLEDKQRHIPVARSPTAHQHPESCNQPSSSLPGPLHRQTETRLRAAAGLAGVCSRVTIYRTPAPR